MNISQVLNIRVDFIKEVERRVDLQFVKRCADLFEFVQKHYSETWLYTNSFSVVLTPIILPASMFLKISSVYNYSMGVIPDIYAYAKSIVKSFISYLESLNEDKESSKETQESAEKGKGKEIDGALCLDRLARIIEDLFNIFSTYDYDNELLNNAPKAFWSISSLAKIGQIYEKDIADKVNQENQKKTRESAKMSLDILLDLKSLDVENSSDKRASLDNRLSLIISMGLGIVKTSILDDAEKFLNLYETYARSHALTKEETTLLGEFKELLPLLLSKTRLQPEAGIATPTKQSKEESVITPSCREGVLENKNKERAQQCFETLIPKIEKALREKSKEVTFQEKAAVFCYYVFEVVYAFIKLVCVVGSFFEVVPFTVGVNLIESFCSLVDAIINSSKSQTTA